MSKPCPSPQEFNSREQSLSSGWIPFSRLREFDCYVGSQYYGYGRDRMLFNIKAFEKLCRENYLPPLIIKSLKWFPHDRGVASDFLLDPMEKQWYDFPSGWEIKVRDAKINYAFQSFRPRASPDEIDNNFIHSFDSILKQALRRIILYEALNMRLNQRERNHWLIRKTAHQLIAILGGLIASEGIPDSFIKAELGLYGFALMQNFLGIMDDWSRPADSDDPVDPQSSSRELVRDWRETNYPDRYEEENFGPGKLKNFIIRSIPFEVMLEPLYRYIGSIREFKNPLVTFRNTLIQ